MSDVNESNESPQNESLNTENDITNRIDLDQENASIISDEVSGM